MELIDGQQRLTTLYLIFQYLQRVHLPNAGPNYAITYETREDSKQYLQRLGKDVDRAKLEADADRNIDFFHMFQAYRRIESWFEEFENVAGRTRTQRQPTPAVASMICCVPAPSLACDLHRTDRDWPIPIR